jgi:(1->4)-alpha-D-glucan 1-alpha-D-glucosylmutase
MPARIPVSTYRLQLHRDFRFRDACELVPYLDALGVTDCYASPFLKASPGSRHGYDICDHSQLNPDIGSAVECGALAAALAARGMGLVADFVPNHMGIDASANPWWRDVLENGPCSPYADFFDIDWDPVKDELHDKVLLPILGDQYGLVLERGELQLAFEAGTFTVRYFEHDLPLNPRQLIRVLEHDIDRLRHDLGADSPDTLEYLSIATALRNLPVYTETDSARVAERHREKEVARERLQRLVAAAPRIRQHIESAVRAFNGEPGRPQSFDHLHALLEAQPYRLAYWRTAAHEINYRRFFDVNELAGLRMERERVFEATHQLLLGLVASEQITGLRIDHVDGLHDPAQYLARLQAAVAAQRPSGAEPPHHPLYVVVEKILAAGESLSPEWPVAGTSGYDFLNDLNGVFVDRANQRALSRVYGRFTRLHASFADVAYASKKLIMDVPMSSELNVLAHALNRLSERDRRTRDFTLNSLRDALEEVVACLSTYRTYVSATSLTEVDRTAIDTAIRRARRRNATMEPSIFAFLRDTLLPQPAAARSAEDQRLRLAFAMKFQQYTGPVQAKGMEDTAFYRYNRLLSLNEVGGAPDRFGGSPEEFHAANQRRRASWPLTMLATATHDTKRGEDARARLNVLSELPEEWSRQLSAWGRINIRNRTIVDGAPAPDRNDEYLFYQSLLGVWPPEPVDAPLPPRDPLVVRMREFMIKAVREAKVHSSWMTQDQAYEDATVQFVERSLTGPTAARFLRAFLPFQGHVARLGMLNSLSQVVLKIASPGVPDFYQGSELWDLSLVDPDNRRPVDYGKRRQMLGEVAPLLDTEAAAPQRAAAVVEMLARWGDGRIKLFLTAAGLRLRRQRAPLFLDGSYAPLAAAGERADHVVAFARRCGDTSAVAIVPRLVAPLTTGSRFLPVGAESWGDTHLLLPHGDAGRDYCNAFTGARLRPEPSSDQSTLPLAAIFQDCPVALLCSIESRA